MADIDDIFDDELDVASFTTPKAEIAPVKSPASDAPIMMNVRAVPVAEWPKKSGQVTREDRSQAHYVQVRFDDRKFSVPCHPSELTILIPQIAAGRGDEKVC